jgi:hypothetical protein
MPARAEKVEPLVCPTEETTRADVGVFRAIQKEMLEVLRLGFGSGLGLESG